MKMNMQALIFAIGSMATFLASIFAIVGWLQGAEHAKKSGQQKPWLAITLVCIIMAVSFGYGAYVSYNVTPTPTPIPPGPGPGPEIIIPAPGCANASDLGTSQFMVHLCPDGFQTLSNPYDDFQAKNEGMALADDSSAILYITGSQALHLKDIPCSYGCLIESDILFHDESEGFRTSTQMGVLFANYGLTIDRNGNVCEVFQQTSGEYTVTPLEQLPNFPTGSNLTSNGNPIKLQIQYASSKLLAFQVSYVDDNGQSQTIHLAPMPSQGEINLANYDQDTVLKIFSQNVVDPKAYQAQFQNNSRDFGDGSIFGVSKLIITPMN